MWNGSAVSDASFAPSLRPSASIRTSDTSRGPHGSSFTGLREDFDIHDRVNYATTKSQVITDAPGRTISLDLTIDTSFAAVIEYFEIFLHRMVMVKQAAEQLGCHFRLVINGTVFS